MSTVSSSAGSCDPSAIPEATALEEEEPDDEEEEEEEVVGPACGAAAAASLDDDLIVEAGGSTGSGRSFVPSGRPNSKRNETREIFVPCRSSAFMILWATEHAKMFS